MSDDLTPSSPAPGRRPPGARRAPVLRWALLGGALAVVAAGVWLLRFGELDRIARGFANRQLAGATNLRLGWRALQGNPLRRVDVVDLTVDLRDARGRWHRFLSAERVTADAGVPQLLQAARLKLAVERPTVVLTVDSSGSVLLPEIRKKSGGGGGGGLEVAPLEVRGGSLVVAEAGRPSVTWGAELDGRFRVELGPATRVAVEALRGRMAPRALRVERLTADLSLGDRGWEFHRLELAGPGVGGRAEGRFASARDFLLDARVDSLGDALISPWLAHPLPYGAFAGRVRLRQAGARLSFDEEGRLTRSPLGPAALAARGDWYHRRVHLADFAVELAGGRASGSGDIDLEGQARLEVAASQVQPERLAFLPATWRVPRTVVNGTSTLLLDWRSAGRTQVTGRAELGQLRVLGQRVERAAGVFEFGPGVARVDSLRVRTGAGQAGGWLALGPGSALRGAGSLEVTLDSLEALERASGEHFGGRLGGGWELAGSLERPDVSGQVELSGFRWRGVGAAAASARVRWQGPGVSGLVAQATLKGLHLGDVEVSGAELEGSGGPVTRFRLSATQGDSSVSGTGEVDWRARRVTVESGALVLGEKRWDQRGVSWVSWAGDSVAWKDVRWRSPDGDSIGTSGSYRPRDGAVALDFHARRWDLQALTAHFLKERAPRGLLSGEIHASGSLAQPRCVLDAQVEGGEFGGHPVDQVQVDGTLLEGRLDLARWEVQHGGSRLEGQLRIDLPRVRARGLRALTEAPDSLLRGATAEGRADLQALELAALGDFSEALRPLTGRATGWVKLHGGLAEPRFEAEITGEEVAQSDLRLGQVRLALSYAGERLTVEQASAEAAGVVSTVTGAVPCRLSLDPPQLRWLDRDMELAVHVPHADLGLIAGLFPSVIAYASGGVEVEAQVRGSPLHPRFQGTARLAGATLRLAGREEVFRDIVGEAVLEDQQVRVKSLHAESGRRGSVDLSGSLAWDAGAVRSYHFDVSARDVPISDQQNYSGLVRGTLQVDPVSAHDLNPLVHGALTVSEGLILMEFGQTPPTLQETREKPTLRWYYDLDVQVPGDLWWKNSQSNIEVAGDLRARNGNGFNEGQGEFDIQRGTFDVYDTSFRISEDPPGQVVFNGPLENPTLTVTATAQVGDRTVELNVPGTRVSELNSPGKFHLSAGDASEAALVNWLTVGRFLGEAAPDTAHEAGREAQPGTPGAPGRTGIGVPLSNLLLLRVQRELGIGFSRFLDVLELGSDPTSERIGVSRVGVGKYVTRDVFVRYGQSLTTKEERDLSLEWRLNKYLFLKGQTARRALNANDPSNSLETDYNMDLKLKFDY
ncbi:MAG TPA: translocation/assembly module TamB domain-containing protein [Candidatus Saccharimonadales bacterium]|nr:translocation/assembly module TamB domain-containing protein [Candidatus Saccharimonadales bacterium]